LGGLLTKFTRHIHRSGCKLICRTMGPSHIHKASAIAWSTIFITSS
jgi:hypothetical protein